MPSVLTLCSPVTFAFSPLNEPPLIGEVAYSLRKHGYTIIENLVSESIINEILAETASATAKINSNDLGTVIHGKTQFFTNIIAHSKTIHDIILSPLVINLCNDYLGDNFQLVNNRIQTTRANMAMPWHTDNNLLSNGKLVGRHDMPGLQFVLYLTNVSKSPFQLIADSHRWSLEHNSQYIRDDDIQELGLHVVELVPSPGSLLILNTHLFHRAAPARGSDYLRSILLFQADKISPEYPEHGEKVFINPEFMTDVSPSIMSFLGFGRKRAYPPFPESSLATLGLEQLSTLQFDLLRVLPLAATHRILKRIIPASIFIELKNIYVKYINHRVSKRDRLPSSPYLDT